MQNIPHIVLLGNGVPTAKREEIKQKISELLEDYLRNSSYIIITLTGDSVFDQLCGEVIGVLKNKYQNFYVELFHQAQKNPLASYPPGVVNAAHAKEDPLWCAVWQSDVVFSYLRISAGRKYRLYWYAKTHHRHTVNLSLFR